MEAPAQKRRTPTDFVLEHMGKLRGKDYPHLARRMAEESPWDAKRFLHELAQALDEEIQAK